MSPCLEQVKSFTYEDDCLMKETQNNMKIFVERFDKFRQNSNFIIGCNKENEDIEGNVRLKSKSTKNFFREDKKGARENQKEVFFEGLLKELKNQNEKLTIKLQESMKLNENYEKEINENQNEAKLIIFLSQTKSKFD